MTKQKLKMRVCHGIPDAPLNKSGPALLHVFMQALCRENWGLFEHYVYLSRGIHVLIVRCSCLWNGNIHVLPTLLLFVHDQLCVSSVWCVCVCVIAW